MSLLVAFYWALVSEPGFSDFQISRLSIYANLIWKTEMVWGNKRKVKKSSGETLDDTDGFEGHVLYIEISTDRKS